MAMVKLPVKVALRAETVTTGLVPTSAWAKACPGVISEPENARAAVAEGLNAGSNSGTMRACLKWASMAAMSRVVAACAMERKAKKNEPR